MRLAILAIFIVCFASNAYADEPLETKINELLKRLQGRDWHERNKASKELAELGAKAVPILRKAYPPLETFEARHRILSVLRKIREDQKETYLKQHPQIAKNYRIPDADETDLRPYVKALNLLANDAASGNETAFLLIVERTFGLSMIVKQVALQHAVNLGPQFLPLLNDLFVHTGETDDLRSQCVSLLGDLKDGANIKLIEDIAFGREKASDILRRNCMSSYATIMGEPSYPAVLKWFGSEDENIRRHAFSSVVNCGKSRAVEFVKQVIKKKDYPLYFGIFHVLRKVDAVNDMMSEIRDMFVDESIPYETRMLMVKYAGRERNPALIPLFDRLLSENKTDSMTSVASWWLQEKPMIEAVDLYAKHFKHPEYTVRFNLALVVGKLSLVETAPHLLEAFKAETNHQVKTEMITTLIKFAHRDALPEMLKELKSEDSACRCAAAWAFYNLHDEGDWKYLGDLLKLLEEEHPAMRRAASVAIQGFARRAFIKEASAWDGRTQECVTDIKKWFKAYEEYRKKTAKACAGAESHKALALWCFENGLYREAARHGNEALRDMSEDAKLKDVLEKSAQELKKFQEEYGEAGYLGVYFAANAYRVFLQRVLKGLPAYEAGLRQYDIIKAVDNKPVTSLAQLTDYLKKLYAGTLVRFDIERVGEKHIVIVKLGKRPLVAPLK